MTANATSPVLTGVSCASVVGGGAAAAADGGGADGGGAVVTAVVLRGGGVAGVGGKLGAGLTVWEVGGAKVARVFLVKKLKLLVALVVVTPVVVMASPAFCSLD
jgi:hypothetical protein